MDSLIDECSLWKYASNWYSQSRINIKTMDAHIQDQYIQKKLLYKFDKKLDQVEQ